MEVARVGLARTVGEKRRGGRGGREGKGRVRNNDNGSTLKGGQGEVRGEWEEEVRENGKETCGQGLR